MNLSVIHAPDDAAAARDLIARLSPFATVKPLPIDELAAMLPANRWQLAPAVGVPLFLVSSAVLSQPERRKALIEGNPVLGSPRFRSYYICRGIEPASIAADDLVPLTEEVMLVSDARIGEVIEDLRAYSTSPELAPQGCGGLFRVLGSTLVMLLEIVLDIIEKLLRLLLAGGAIAAVALLVSLAVERLVPWRPWLVALCGFGWATILAALETLDLWPWFGRTYRVSRDDPRTADALRLYRDARRHLLRLQLGLAAFFIVPVILAPPPRAAAWFGCGVAAGVARALLARWIARRGLVRLAEQKGLRSSSLTARDRSVAALDVAPLPWLLEAGVFPAGEEQIVRRWLTLITLGAAPAVHRPFLAQPDHAFISYVWADDAAIRTANALADTLTALGIPHFLDRRHVGNGFIGWRSHVARELERATHVFIVASPRFTSGRFVQRELRTIVQRWHVEQLPAVVCVAEDEVASALMRSSDSPLELRFMLAACPRLTPAAVTDRDLIRRIVVQRRRQGRLRDWLALLGPRRAEAMLERMIW